MFKIGDKVVCIKPFSGFNASGIKVKNSLPIKGEIYTFDGANKNGFLYLKEINEIAITGRAAFNPNKFRKLSDIWSEQILEEISEQIEQEELILEN